MNLPGAPTRLKVLWYLLFSVVGVFHAEVLSWSSPDVLYNPANFLLVTPVYAVHYILFGDLILRYRHRGWGTLYVFGCLTGMYETFITKVYWSPPWNPDAAGPLGIAWIELLWIGFTWHAFMSFLIPFRLMDGLFAPENGRPFQKRSLRTVLWATPVLGAVTGYGFGPTIDVMLTSVLLSFLIILLLSGAFLVASRRWGLTDSQQLLFGRKGRWLAVAFFSAVYVGYGALLRPEFLPIGVPLIPVFLIYVGLVYLAVTLLRSPEREMPSRKGEGVRAILSLKYLLFYMVWFVTIFLVLGGVNTLIPGAFLVVAGGLMIAGAGLPLVLLPLIAARSVRLRRRAWLAAQDL